MSQHNICIIQKYILYLCVIKNKIMKKQIKKLDTGIMCINDSGTIRVNSPYDNEVTNMPIKAEAYYLDEIMSTHFRNLGNYYNQKYLR